MKHILTALITCALSAPLSAQQNLPTPQASPAASVSQTIGITEVTVSYHRPGAKGRKIWGGLVPYDAVWRAGANENTTISFSGPVLIGGKTITAGTYGLHMIPTPGEWTIIFSTNSTSWGSFSYDEREDAFRVTVKPRKAPRQEWLSYQFNDLASNGATLSLRWEELEIPLRIEVDVHAAVLQNARDVYLRGLARFGWQGWYQAANYCALNNVNLEEGIEWADRSIRMNRTFNNLWVKGVLLQKTGKTAEGTTAKEEALNLGTEVAINAMGYQYLLGGDTEEALALFKFNVEKFPDSWNVYDSLGEGYAAAGETKLAIEYYRKALSKVEAAAQQERIRQILQTLEGK